MKVMKSLSLLLITGLFLLNSCKDEEKTVTPTPTPSKSKTEMLTAKSWIMTAWTITTSGFGTSDEFATLDACEKDNLRKFNTDKTYTEDEGATKCDPDDPQIIITGNWEFADSETSLIFDKGTADEMTVKIASLTTTTMVATITESVFGVTVTTKMTFKVN